MPRPLLPPDGRDGRRWSAAPASLSERLLAALDKLGRNLLRDGKPVEGDEAKRLADELVADILSNRLPLWQKLGAMS